MDDLYSKIASAIVLLLTGAGTHKLFQAYLTAKLAAQKQQDDAKFQEKKLESDNEASERAVQAERIRSLERQVERLIERNGELSVEHSQAMRELSERYAQDIGAIREQAAKDVASLREQAIKLEAKCDMCLEQQRICEHEKQQLETDLLAAREEIRVKNLQLHAATGGVTSVPGAPRPRRLTPTPRIVKTPDDDKKKE